MEILKYLKYLGLAIHVLASLVLILRFTEPEPIGIDGGSADTEFAMEERNSIRKSRVIKVFGIMTIVGTILQAAGEFISE